jgi:GrpB-like predicted nucleotidyltransferase (UPF0157 family)
MSDQRIELVDYDPRWVDRFVEQKVALTSLLAPWLSGQIEHIGSTSVPGLRAKPVVDLLAPVHSLNTAQSAISVLEADGWLFWPTDPNRLYRLWFLRPKPTARTHHLQIIEHDHPDCRALAVFRDALRGDAKLRDAYASLKDELAAKSLRTARLTRTPRVTLFNRCCTPGRGSDPHAGQCECGRASIHPKPLFA